MFVFCLFSRNKKVTRIQLAQNTVLQQEDRHRRRQLIHTEPRQLHHHLDHQVVHPDLTN